MTSISDVVEIQQASIIPADARGQEQGPARKRQQL